MSKMAMGFAQKAGLKVFQEHLNNYTPADPLYETFTDAKGRQRRRKRELPPGLSKRDAAILKSVKRRAHYLDKGFVICGARFGWTFLIGLVPVIGDVADASLSYFLIIRKARKAEIPDWLLRRMMMNNTIAAGVNFIPIAGDVIMAAFKADSRNAALLEEYLRIRGEAFLEAQAGRTDPDATVAKPGAGRKANETIPIPKKGEVIPESQIAPAERHGALNAASTSKSATVTDTKGKGPATKQAPASTAIAPVAGASAQAPMLAVDQPAPVPKGSWMKSWRGKPVENVAK